MNTNNFDSALCTACGICKEVCPIGIISEDKTKHPFIAKQIEEICLKCGQCEAFCPANAVQVNGDALKPNAPSKESGEISPGQLGAYFRSRRSIRNYKQKPVDKGTLEELFDIVRYAPTGVNRQEIQWIVLSDPEKLKKCKTLIIEWMRQTVAKNPKMPFAPVFSILVANWDKGIDMIGRNAPHVVIAHAKKEERVAPTDGIIALSHMELMAPSFGLGACWAGYFMIAGAALPALVKEMGVPDGHVFIGALLMGYPKHKNLRVPKRKPASVEWK